MKALRFSAWMILSLSILIFTACGGGGGGSAEGGGERVPFLLDSQIRPPANT